MKGWELVAFGQPLELVEREDPTPGPGEVVLDVKGAGLCHSDVAAMQGGADWMLHKIIGHELAGVVSALGEDVTEWTIGDRVSVCPTASASVPGYMRDGGFATKHLAPAGDLVAIPDAVDWTLGAQMTDAGMTSYHALVVRGGLTAGMKVGIIGLGGLGQIAARVAVLRGADVHVAEPKKDAWPLAERLGVTHVVADVAEWENGGFDLIVDYAGYGTTTDAALHAVRFNGTVVLVRLGVREGQISLGEMITRQSSLLASRGGTKQDIAELYELVATGELVPEVTEIGFDDIPRGLADLTANKVTGRLVALI
ncbi:zinc-binding dehydrogenase [Cellulomonas sp. WB94]|uniref:alcohol dehydrogenase catalytic domain-containing protein n=1 Tax=Cellulomonas sp. WB94 TaxID=2173174 RepID=UPI0018D55629|nr:zinc-binding dehydrogenase [Cellulomonas sp. WB94]